ncbi:MAG: hypothetical protein ABW278_03620 [Steroidobacteraceae bacterium]
MSHPLQELTKDQCALLRARLHTLTTTVQAIGAAEGVAGSPIEQKICEVVAAIEAFSADLAPAEKQAPDAELSMHDQATARARSEVDSGEIDMQG